MAEFFKHEIAKWNVATDDLTLEQEAAYHRVVATIRLYERPFRHNLRVLSGLWRCNERRAKRLLEELVFAGKLTIEDGFIIDEKAVDDASTLRQSRVDKASAGRLGGIESGKARRKPLENNDTDEAPASTREEKAREEKKEKKEIGKPISSTSADFEKFWIICPRKISKEKARQAYVKALRKADPKTIDDGMARYAAIRAGQDAQFTAHPATWLNAERWTDQPDQQSFQQFEGNYDSRPANISGPAKSRPGDGSGTIAAFAAVAAKYAGRAQ